jgi:hypothetical protein
MSGPCHAVLLAQTRDRKRGWPSAPQGDDPLAEVAFTSHSWTIQYHCDNKTLLDTASGYKNIAGFPASTGPVR